MDKENSIIEEIQQFLELISLFFPADLALTGKTGTIICGTGSFKKHLGCNLPEGCAAQINLGLRKQFIIYRTEGRKAKLCMSCSIENKCKYKLGIFMPIKAEVFSHIYFACVQNFKMVEKDMSKYIDFMNFLAAYISNICALNKHEISNEIANQKNDYNTILNSIIGSSDAIQDVKHKIKRFSSVKLPILITGETGTGKEVVARALHNYSKIDYPFVSINCNAIPENLLESELFGYTRGAFTGASIHGRKGKFVLANNGTIFLDEIGDLPLQLQGKLLRVLEENVIEPIGSNQQIKVNIRVISATNKNLEDLVESGSFRQDLYFRLNILSIKLPSLKERKEDIPLLLDFFQNQYSKNIIKFDDTLMYFLLNYEWPGNVRELKNVTEYILALHDNTLKSPDLSALPDYLSSKNDIIKVTYSKEHNSFIHNVEKDMIKNLLTKYGSTTQSKQRIAKQLNVHLSTLYRKIQKYDLY